MGRGPGRGAGGRGLCSDPQHGAMHTPPCALWLWAGSSEAKRKQPPRLPRARAAPAAPGATKPLPRHLGPQSNVPPPSPDPSSSPGGWHPQGWHPRAAQCSGRVQDSHVLSPTLPSLQAAFPHPCLSFPKREPAPGQGFAALASTALRGCWPRSCMTSTVVLATTPALRNTRQHSLLRPDFGG